MPAAPEAPSERQPRFATLLAATQGGAKKPHEQRQYAAQHECREGHGHFEEPIINGLGL